MALRTFQSNPALGGFGDESSSAFGKGNGGDAFCQVIKELVDNAVDACCQSVLVDDDDRRNQLRSEKDDEDRTVGNAKRVRVVIEPLSNSDDDDPGDTKYLKVTVSDNGCGMVDIQACVDPFHTSKGHGKQKKTKSGRDSNGKKGQTAGRYGIGLTLALLHSQRILLEAERSRSCACIRSATADQPYWTSMKCIVDAQNDRVRCSRMSNDGDKSTKKAFATESGTAVSVLVPGGVAAQREWPRLAEYLARFQLAQLPCTVEVLAPTLAKLPLCIRPTPQSRVTGGAAHEKTKKPLWQWNHAIELFLGYPCSVDNVARAVVPIRGEGSNGTRHTKPLTTGDESTMEVILAVLGDVTPDDDDEDSNMDQEHNRRQGGAVDDDAMIKSAAAASMGVVRLVNHTPLLDSAEGMACGIVQGIPAKRQLWNAYGLEVALEHHQQPVGGSRRSSSTTAPIPQGHQSFKRVMPTISVKDSEQVAPFLEKGTHSLFQATVDPEQQETTATTCAKRRKRGGKAKHVVLPAQTRLGKMLLVVHIHAEPSKLPLPTLSKGRLPVDNPSIDSALHVALTHVLRDIQKSNPDLLLSPSQLKQAQRDNLYIPSSASSIMSILARSAASEESTSTHPRVARALSCIQRWQKKKPAMAAFDDGDSDDDDDSVSNQRHLNIEGVINESRLPPTVAHLTGLVKERFRETISSKTKSSSRRATTVVTPDKDDDDTDETSDIELGNFDDDTTNNQHDWTTSADIDHSRDNNGDDGNRFATGLSSEDDASETSAFIGNNRPTSTTAPPPTQHHGNKEDDDDDFYDDW